MDEISAVMEKGTYYIGDLCYVIEGDAWIEAVNLMYPDKVTDVGIYGKHTLSDGRKFAIYSTKYGDGCYDGLGVDSGSIGCIKESDIEQPIRESLNWMHLGRVVKFNEDFNTSGDDNGTIRFGDIKIRTGYDDDGYCQGCWRLSDDSGNCVDDYCDWSE